MNDETFLTEKEQKYDRQLRLWGADGQLELEKSNICALGSDSLVCETLKNLILPGLGAFTIIDDAIVDESDIANNFFVTNECLGKPRAEVTTQLLHELNSDVKSVNYLINNPKKVVYEKNYLIMNNFNVVLASADMMTCDELAKLAAQCNREHISLFVVRIYGFIGYLRLQVPEYAVIETKPDFPIFDLRIQDPIPGMMDYANKFSFDKCKHGHIPFPVILIKTLQTWQSQNGKSSDSIPETLKEKQAYKDLILKMSKNNQQENFEEAYNRALYAYLPYTIPHEIRSIMNSEKAKNLTANSPIFWIVIRALNKFFANEGNGKLPLNGSLPDMTCETALFIELQNLYKEKASNDIKVLTRYVSDVLDELGLSKTYISPEYIEKIAKNIFNVRYCVFRTLEEEYKLGLPAGFSKILATTDSENHFFWYVLLRAADVFYANNSRYPGQTSQDYLEDATELKEIVDKIIFQYDLSDDLIEKLKLDEFLRFGNCRLNTMASLMGGIAAQEIIKVVTSQWVPLNNTLIFNGIDNSSVNFEL